MVFHGAPPHREHKQSSIGFAPGGPFSLRPDRWSKPALFQATWLVADVTNRRARSDRDALECTTSSDRGGSDQIFAGSIRCPHQARRCGLGRQVTMAEYRANRVSVTRDPLV